MIKMHLRTDNTAVLRIRIRIVDCDLDPDPQKISVHVNIDSPGQFNFLD